MRYRVTFEFDTDPVREPEGWYWRELLNRVDSEYDSIDWSTFLLEKRVLGQPFHLTSPSQ